MYFYWIICEFLMRGFIICHISHAYCAVKNEVSIRFFSGRCSIWARVEIMFKLFHLWGENLVFQKHVKLSYQSQSLQSQIAMTVMGRDVMSVTRGIHSVILYLFLFITSNEFSKLLLSHISYLLSTEQEEVKKLSENFK